MIYINFNNFLVNLMYLFDDKKGKINE